MEIRSEPLVSWTPDYSASRAAADEMEKAGNKEALRATGGHRRREGSGPAELMVSIRTPLPIITNSLSSCARTASGSDSAPPTARTTRTSITRPILGYRFDLDMWGPSESNRARCCRSSWSGSSGIGSRRALSHDHHLAARAGGQGSLTFTHEGFNLDSLLSRRALEGLKPSWPAVLAKAQGAAARDLLTAQFKDG